MTPIRPEHQARYPGNWHELRERVLERAGDACEWCGAQNHEPHRKTGSTVVLTIAHVYDKRPEACSMSNLAALCQRCHNRHDAHGRRHGTSVPPPGPQPVQRPLREVSASPP